MGQAEYIVRFKGDYSALQKDINKINGETRKLANDEVIIKLNYDGNIQEFNKVFDQMSKMHPELDIQFQYNVNQKMLEQEMDKLQKLSQIKLDVDEDNALIKINKMIDNIELSLQKGLPKEKIQDQLREVFGYYNTAVKSGAKNLDFDNISDRIYRIFDLKGSEFRKIFDDMFDQNATKPIKLFEFDDSVDNELKKTKDRITDIEDTLAGLEKRGASKSGLPSDLQKLQDEIKILRSNIGDMQEQLKDLSGEAFNNMTEQIKLTNEQLNYSLEALTKLKKILSSNGLEINNSVGGVIKQWQDEEETKIGERYTAFNTKTKKTSGAHLVADAEGTSMKLIRSAIDEMGSEAEGTIHSHPMKYAAFSDNDIEMYFKLLKDSQEKIWSHAVTSAEQAISIDMTKVDTSKEEDILKEIRDSYSEIDEKIKGEMGERTADIKNRIISVLDGIESESPLINEMTANIKNGLDEMFKKLGDSYSLTDYQDAFDDLEFDAVNKVAKKYASSMKVDVGALEKKLAAAYTPVLGEIENSIFDSINDQAQQSYQEVLKKVFTNPEFLKSGETSAIKIEALTDFIDWGSIEDSATKATQKAADAIKKAQDSNSPAELTKPLGKDFGAGYAEGIKEAMPDIVAACKKIVLGAYNAIKEASESEEGKDNNFADSFINKFKASLEEAIPTIQEKIKDVFSKIDIGDENASMFTGIGQEIIDSIIVGLKDEHSASSFTETIETTINNAFRNVVLDSAVRNLLVEIQTTLDFQGALRLKYFSVDTDSIVFEIQNGLDNKTFNINLGGTIQDLATTLNTSAENVRLTFIDAIKWIREANEIQKSNAEETRERQLFYNSKTGEFSNPTVVGDTHSVKHIVSRSALNTEKYERGKNFDTDLHWHQDYDWAAPSPADLVFDFVNAYEDGITKFVVGAQKDFIEIDFTKIAKDRDELVSKVKTFLNDNIEDVIEKLKNHYNKYGDKDNIYGSDIDFLDNFKNVLPDDVILRTYGQYLSALLRNNWERLKDRVIKNAQTAATEDYKANGGMFDFEALKEASADIYNEIFKFPLDIDKNKLLGNNDVFDDFNYRLRSDSDMFITDFTTMLAEEINKGIDYTSFDGTIGSIKEAVEIAFDDTIEGSSIYSNFVDNDKFSEFKEYIINSASNYIDNIFDTIQSKLTPFEESQAYQLAGQIALDQIKRGTLLDNAVEQYDHDEFEAKFGSDLAREASPVPIKQYIIDDLKKFVNDFISSIDAIGDLVDEEDVISVWKNKILTYFPELLESQADKLYDIMASEGFYGDDLVKDKYLSKINNYVALNSRKQQSNIPQSQLPFSPTIPEDFQQQLQSVINESGKYIVKVYGELVEDFKSRLQVAIDEIGLYHVDIEGWLAEHFHDDLQRDIDGQDKYVVEVKGKLFNTFKQVLQELIDGLGAFPIEVKPYMRKGGKIEEVDLPSGNTTVSSDESTDNIDDQTEALKQEEEQAKETAKAKEEAANAGEENNNNTSLLSKKQVVEQLRSELNLTKKAAEDLFDEQGYDKTNNKYQIEQSALDELIASLKEKKEIEESEQPTATSAVATAMQEEVSAVDAAIEAEKKKFDELKNKISKTIPNAIDKKNQAFEKERDVVAKAVDDEIDYFEVLENTINGVTGAIGKQYDTAKNAKPKVDTSETKPKETTKTDTTTSRQRSSKSDLSSLDKIEKKIRDIGLDAYTTQRAIDLLGGGKDTFLWLNRNLDDQADKVNALIDIYKELGIIIDSVEDNDGFNTTITTKSLKNLSGQRYQSVGQKSEVQQQMADYYTQMQKEADNAYAEAKSKADSLLKKIDKLRNSGKYTQDFVDELNSAQSELTDFLDQIDKGTIPFEEIGDRVKLLADNIEDTLSKKAFNNVKQAAEKTLTNVGLKIDQIIAKNSAMGSEFEARFNKLKDALKDAQSIESVQKIVAEVNKLESELISAGKTGKSFFDQIKQRLRDINSKYIAQYFSFQDIIRYARQAATNVIELNDAFIELSKVSNTSLKALESDFQSYATTAKDIGGTITDTISATSDWARMGYSVPDSKELARVAMLYKNVGDGIDISQANESLISTLQGYQMTADESEHIVDVFNEVANNFAIDSGGIGEALQRSAASLNAANTSLEQSVALVTAANTVVQNPESVGTTFKTLSARIRGATTELQDLGEEEDEFTQTTSKLQGLVKSLTGFDILEADQKTFKSIYDILVGIGKEWKNLDDIERASLGEALAGKRNANVLYSVLDNIETLEKAYQTAEESAGSAQREQENYQKGITYSVNQAKAALEELSYDAINSDFLKGLVDTGTDALELIDSLIDKFGVLKTALIGIGTVIGSQKLG